VSGPPDIALFFGRLHPLLVHLPIGLIVLLAVLEILARYPRFKHATASSGLILALAVPAALVTVLCGWLLSQGGGYENRLLQWHKWTGIATAAACALAALLYWLDVKKAYRFFLFGSLGVLVLASHFGGSLTHGSDYLVHYAPDPFRTWLGGRPKTPPPSTKDFASQPVFAVVVKPILDKNCIACHGPEKSKGKLRLDSIEAALKGGENGPVILPGKSATSELVKRIKLDPSSDDHMPPDGKPQPSSDEISLLEWWIDAGAVGNKTLAELKTPANIARILQARFGAPAALGHQARSFPPKPLEQLIPIISQLNAELGIDISQLSQTAPWLQCNAGIAGTNFGDADLAKLAPLAANLRWLDLAGTRISDAGLVSLASMPNLIRVHLERTAVTDAGLKSLTALPALEYLDLYGTAVTDAGLEQLQMAPKLKQLYLWDTQVTTTGAQAFVELRTDHSQLQRWQDEIEQLKARIRDAKMTVELGTSVAAAPTNNAAPMNTLCPISGKPINLAKTVLYEGKLLAFCCDDCKARFQQDPKPVLAKLGLTGTNTENVAGKPR
jgi:uncharacterized membrane protein/YHS domain-containing protein